MVQRIIGFCAERRGAVLIVFGVLCSIAWGFLHGIKLDALPDLSDTQVIVYSRWDRSPDIIEDQVSYPIITALLGAPKVKAIRGFSDFGFSYVYVIFEDGTDIYWARSRVIEYLSKIQSRLPEGVRTELGPDATGVGWVYQYSLVDDTGQHSLDELRSFQDWTLRYAIGSVPGVAEVASLGGFVRQYQVVVDPNRLSAHGIGLMDVVRGIRAANQEVGGRLLEWSATEYMVRGRGYVRKLEDLEQIALKTDLRGTPVLLRDVARVELGPELRRGVSDLDGKGNAVSGIVVMRHGENALQVIERVKDKLEELRPSLPAGARFVTTYDRSDLILRAIDTLKHELVLEMIIVSIVILIFLWHIPSSMVPILTIPISVLLSFLPMYLLDVPSNIMSLAGIAISIGVLVDGAIVEVENAYNKLQAWQAGGGQGDAHAVRLEALKEVGPSVFFSLLVIAVSFLPIFALEGQEGRLFRPMAITKTLVMGLAALLAVTLDPAMRMMLARTEPYRFWPRPLARLASGVLVGTYYAEERHPISRLVFRIYEPACRFVLRWPMAVILAALALVGSAAWAYQQLGSEFMPPLYEGSLLYMPTTLPGISVTEAERLLQVQDRLILEVPEVERVFGKAGRADTSTDPAPFSMFETTILLRPEAEWRRRERWWSGRVPRFARSLVEPFWPETISHEDLVAELDQKLRIPGVTNAWTMPIKTRIDMLSTGVRTPIGIKILGADLKEIERLGLEIEPILRKVPGTRSVFAERVTGGFFVDFDLNRGAIARYGLSIEDVQTVIMSAIGGENVSTVIAGRERYPVNVRYPRELRSDLDRLGRVLVPTMTGAQIPLGQLASIRTVLGPSMIRDEGGKLAGYVYVDVDLGKTDLGSYVAAAKAAVDAAIKRPTGYQLIWSGQYEAMERVKAKLKVIVPITIALIAFILYLNTRSGWKTALVMLAVPFSLVGAVWLLYALGYHVSIAVWVGMIALAGLDAETGIFMLVFLELSHQRAIREGRMRTLGDLEEAIIHGAVKRARPKLMTVAAAFMGLLPILWSTGAGADVMKRIAAPMIGGLFTSFLLEMLVYPAVYYLKHKKDVVPGPASPGSLG